MSSSENIGRGAPDSIKTGSPSVDKVIDSAYGQAAPDNPPAPAQPFPVEPSATSKFLGRIPGGWNSIPRK